MWLLHTWLPDDHVRAAADESTPERGRNQGLAERQSVSLHRLPGHPGVGPACRRAIDERRSEHPVSTAPFPALPSDLPVSQPRYVAKDVARLEDPLLLTGRAEFG